MHNKTKGEIAEAAVLAYLVKNGHVVLTPWGGSQRYDLVVHVGNRFIRVQVKTARSVRDGTAIQFKTSSSMYHHHADPGSVRGYKGEADYFAAYYPETGEIFWVPVDSAPNKECTLRLVDTKNRQQAGINYAVDFSVIPFSAEVPERSNGAVL